MVSPHPVAPPIVALLTDFGSSDAYVGVMKGVILGLAPSARLVDLSHEAPPQDIARAAFILETTRPYFPAGTIFLVIVDPGVGSPRRRLALSIDGRYFVGPDNGVLSGALPEAIRGRRKPGEEYEARLVELSGDITAVSIEKSDLFLQPLSATFEGRDVFAPVAAYLATGGSLHDLGAAAGSILALPAFRAPAEAGRLSGLVLQADHFGNLITDIHAADLPPSPAFRVGGRLLPLARNYAEAAGPAAIVSSSGRIEIAAPGGHAARLFGIGPGDRVLVSPG